MKFRGIVVEADKPNSNNRIYPLSVLNRVVQEAQSIVSNRSLMGRIGYPEGNLLIELSQVSHIVTELLMDGSSMVAEIETLNTPQGKVLETMIEQGIVALRPLGMGTVKTESGILDDNYRLISISAVLAKDAA